MERDSLIYRRIAVSNSYLAITWNVVLVLLIVYADFRGHLLIPTHCTAIFTGSYLFYSISVLYAILTRKTEHLKDPGLTHLQIYGPITVAFLFSAIFNDFYAPLYLLIIIVIAFAAFFFSPRQYMKLSTYVAAVFVLVELSFLLRGHVHKNIYDNIVLWAVFAFCVYIMTFVCKSYYKLKNVLKKKNKELEEASEAKSLFLANMSHELRTPLNGVVGMSSVLVNTSLKNDQKKMVEVINTSSNNLLELINSILDYSKLEANRLRLELQPVELKKLASDAMTITTSKNNTSMVLVKSDFDPALASLHLGDELRIKQILINLLSNSLKFTQVGEIKLAMRLIEEKDDQQLIRISVSDSGIGISEEKQQEIFQKFEQADSSTTRQYGGTGLGLSIVSELLKLMGSSIHLESKLNNGTRIWFDLNLRVAKQFKVETPPKNEVFDANNSKLILIVDDEPTNRLVTGKIIEALNYQFEQVENGKEAIEACNTKKYDLILMDCQMPIIDGYSATKKIRSNSLNSETTIVALTANALKGDKEKCFDAGMDGYIAKPVRKDLLKNELERYFSRP